MTDAGRRRDGPTRRDALRVGAVALATPALIGAGEAAVASSGGSTPVSHAASGRRLRYGTAQQARLLPEHVARIVPEVSAGLTARPEWEDRPLYPGAVVLVARHGVIVEHQAMGHALRYINNRGEEYPRDEWIPMRDDTIFDVASISKLFTAVATMRQVELGLIDLDAPVAAYIPEFAQNGKAGVTLRHVLTHSAGLPPGLNINPYPTVPERWAAIYAVGLRAEPGTRYIYSDLSLIVVGRVLEVVTGKPLDQLVREVVIEPLGLRDTMHNPPESLRHRIAPTEWQANERRQIWGEVHDRTSWLLEGRAGHAGVFSTAYDLAVFAQMLLSGGRYGGGTRVIRRDSVQALWTNGNAHLGHGAERGLGFDMYKHSFMSAMATPHTVGHTGFTGTSIVIDPGTDTFAILLTNKVHPTRAWHSTGPARRAVADQVARAVAVHPAEGRWAWFSGMRSGTSATLTLPLPEYAGAARLEFLYWWDTEPRFDTAVLEASADGGSTYAPVGMRLQPWGGGTAPDGVPRNSDGEVTGYQGRQWYRTTAALPVGTTHVRWRYTTDRGWLGRGVYVDGVRVIASGRVIFEDSRPADAARWRADGFARSRD